MLGVSLLRLCDPILALILMCVGVGHPRMANGFVSST